MTILASNSLTISNINDGTITHTAYAYSADGTDRFTTVYPNLNLLNFNSGVTLGKHYGWPANSTSWAGNRAYFKKVNVIPNNKYTISANWANTSWLSVYGFTNESDTVAVARYGSSTGSITGFWDSSFVGGFTVTKNMTFTVPTNVNYIGVSYCSISTDTLTLQSLLNGKPKVEQGSIATTWMPSSSEVTNADWPSYIGQYSDLSSTASTDPAKYVPWTVFKGKDGATGPQGPQGLKGDPGATGIPGQAGADGKTSYLHIAYATNSTGTAGFDVSNATGKTYIGQYTDFTSADSTDPSKYKWSLIKGDKGDKGDQGDQGPAGSNGDPGKIVSDTEPTTKFKGLTWKYSGTADITASDGTTIFSGTEYYYSGNNWILSSINSHNINGDNLSVTNGTFTNGKIKSTWNSGTASGSTEIETSHINMSATDSSSKATNSLGLDVQQGLGMRWTDPNSSQSRSVLLDYGNLVFDRNGVAAGLNFDGTNLSSSMPIQATNTIVKTAQFSVSGIGIRLDRMMSFVAVTFSGQAASTINNSPTISNMIPAGFRPISPYSIDYMVPGNVANSGYIYFNPDGSIRIMATINSGYYIRGTRFYISNDTYPS